MALFPYEHPMMRSGNWFDYPTPARIFDQGFGAGVFGDDPLMRDMQRQAECMMRQPYWMRANNQPKGDTGVSEVQCDKDQFQVKLDVRHFKPEELTVKTVDNTLTVEGKHCEKMDEHGFVQRHFVRKYVLPKGVDPGEVSSNLSPHGVLTCKAPMPATEGGSSERTIPIQPAPGLPAVQNKK